MTIYLNLILVALVTIYIVDISGFTASWRAMLAKALKVTALKPLPPFDCGTCMTWWACLIFAICSHHFTLGTIVASAILSLLSVPIGQLMILVREWLSRLIDKLMPR